MPVNLTKQQVQDSPGIDTEQPISRQHEAALHAYYGWPVYWGLEPYVGVGYPVPTHLPSTAKEKNAPAESPPSDPHLRSTREVTGYHIRAVDGEIGHVQDLIVEDETWAVCYVVVNTQNWLPGKSVLVFPPWIKRVSWDKSEVFVDLSRESIKNSPAFDPSKPVSRGYEERLFEHYGRPKYWGSKRLDQAGLPQGSAAKREAVRVPALIADLGDRSATIREHAHRALVAMGKVALKPLLEALTNSTEYGRGQAAKALGEIGDPTVAPALVKALEDDKYDVRWLAARALVALGRDGLAALLPALIERPHSTWLREGAHHVLHDERYAPWHEQLAPIMEALESYDAADALPTAVEAVLRSLAHRSGAAKK